MAMKNMKTYNQLLTLKTFKERFEYLKLDSQVGNITFGYARYINQKFYQSPEWRQVKRQVIIRDNGFDLGCEGYAIIGRPIIHHINPITIEDLTNKNPFVLDPNNLILVSDETHRAIHLGLSELLPSNELIERTPGDTLPWR